MIAPLAREAASRDKARSSNIIKRSNGKACKYMYCVQKNDAEGRTVCSVEKSVRSQKVFRSKIVTETMTVSRRRDASRRSLHSVAKYLYDIEVSSSPFPPRRAIKPHTSKIEMFDSETNPAPIIDLQGRRSSNKETSVAEKIPKHAFFRR